MPTLELRPALEDNIIPFIVHGENFWSVDPGDIDCVQSFVNDNPKLKCAGIFATHHHADHTDAIPLLRERFACPVYGPEHEKMLPFLTDILVGGSVIPLFDDVEVTAISTPGHTVPALSFHVPALDGKSDYLFSGDTLFGAGCGRLFEGSPSQMWNSLDNLRELDGDTLLVCGHEFTATNLRFALTLNWRTEALEKELSRVEELTRQGHLSLPRPLSLELATNPFLNADSADLKESMGLNPKESAVSVFAQLRNLRNFF